MPTKEVIEAATLLVLTHDVKRYNDQWQTCWESDQLTRDYRQSELLRLIKEIEKAKKKCAKEIKLRFGGAFKQPNVFIEKILNETE